MTRLARRGATLLARTLMWLAALHGFVLMPLGPLALVRDAHAGDGSCRKVGETCVDGPGTKLISGQYVSRECWRYQAQYECVDAGSVIDSCQPLLDRGCAQIGATCLTSDNTGTCTLWEGTYRCATGPARTQSVTDCAGQLFCAGGSGAPERCFDTGYPPDQDFGKAVAALEAGRQAGTYLDPAALQLFKGEAGSCGIRYGGLANCCKRNSGGGGNTLSNAAYSAGMKAGGAVVEETGKEAWRAGSNYVYDRLFSSGGFAQQGIEAIQVYAGEEMVGAASAGSTFTLYGFEFAFTFAEGFTFVAFDPWSFALSIAIMVILEMMKCTADEQHFALKLGNDLCHHVGSYCAAKSLGTCSEQKQSYCCFNSKLARILNEQGRTQLGRGWGDVQAPDCRGFTLEEIQRIDFAQIDWSEFIAQIQAQLPDAAKLLERNQRNINRKLQCYYAGQPC